MASSMENGGLRSPVAGGGPSKLTVVMGAQWGDEGKGKIVDLLAQVNCHYVARCQGGNNAGHTVVANGRTFDFHLLPSGIIHDVCVAVIGNGVVVNLPELMKEVEKNDLPGLFPDRWHTKLRISDRAHLVFDYHQQIDVLTEALLEASGKSKLGTTKKGIGPTYSSKAARDGIRVCDLMAADFAHFRELFTRNVDKYRKLYVNLKVDVDAELARYETLRATLQRLELVTDTSELLLGALRDGRNVLVEGANGALLDLDFGSYPYVTSSSCSIGGVLTGLGVPPATVGDVVGVVKAYQTRVGAGPFPTELFDETGVQLQSIGGEVGVTTGRKRRCGWLDLVLLKYSASLNGLTAIALTKVDVMDAFEAIQVCTAYRLDGRLLDRPPAVASDLARVQVEYQTLPGWLTETKLVRRPEDMPPRLHEFVRFIETFVGVPVKWIGVGQDRLALVKL